jgi:molybdate transport system substrate-binding protein
MKIGLLFAALLIAVSILPAEPATADDIKVLSIPFRGPMDVIGPRFEKATGHKLAIAFAPSDPLKKRIDAGEPFDAILIFPNLVDELIKQGKVAAGSRVDIARAPLGLAVKKGAAKPDVSSNDAFRRALLDAKSISYAAAGPSGVHLLTVLERLGITAEIKPKLRPMSAGSLVVGPVAKGEVEVGVVSTPFILADPGAELAGLLPRDLQDYVRYSSGIGAAAVSANAAKAFVSFLLHPDSMTVMKSNGLEPVDAP